MLHVAQSKQPLNEKIVPACEESHLNVVMDKSQNRFVFVLIPSYRPEFQSSLQKIKCRHPTYLGTDDNMRWMWKIMEIGLPTTFITGTSRGF